jgi:hypothetical protein
MKNFSIVLICAFILITNNGFTIDDPKHHQIDQNTLENAFLDDTIGQIVVRDSSGMVIMHDDEMENREFVKILMKKTNEMMLENDTQKLTKQILAIMILCFVFLSCRKRKIKNKNDGEKLQ